MRCLVTILLLLLPIHTWADTAKRRPSAELAVKTGPTFSLGYGTSLDYEAIHVAPGAHTSFGVVSAYYAYATNDNACADANGVAGNYGSTRVRSCSGQNQQLGGYFRVMPKERRFRPWIGVGLAYYWTHGSGSVAFTPSADTFDLEAGSFSVRRSERGLFPFLVGGGEIGLTDRLAAGLDFAPGFRIPTYVNDDRSERSSTLSLNVGLRLSITAY